MQRARLERTYPGRLCLGFKALASLCCLGTHDPDMPASYPSRLHSAGYRELDVEAGPSPAAVGRRKKEKSGRIACARPQWEDATILNLSYQADPELNPN